MSLQPFDSPLLDDAADRYGANGCMIPRDLTGLFDGSGEPPTLMGEPAVTPNAEDQRRQSRPLHPLVGHGDGE